MRSTHEREPEMLTDREIDRIKRVNRRNQYCLTPDMLDTLFKRHERARKSGDAHTMELIEYRLSDVNFHQECGYLIAGQYDKIDEIIRNW